MSKETIIKLYAVRDKNTDKFVNNITNPRHKFWEMKKFCESAIANYYKYHARYEPKYDLEMVELVCVDVNEYANFNKLADLYIKDTACDGQLFCGCRREDCENYKTKECHKCLIKYLNDIENN